MNVKKLWNPLCVEKIYERENIYFFPQKMHQ